MDGQVGAFGQPAVDEPVGVLVDGALPGLVGVAEVDVDAAELGDGVVVGHLAAAVPGEGSAQLGRDLVEDRHDGVGGGAGAVGAGGVIMGGEPQVPGGAVHDGEHCGRVAGADDLVAFVVADLDAVVGCGWPGGDAVEVTEGAGSLPHMALRVCKLALLVNFTLLVMQVGSY